MTATPPILKPGQEALDPLGESWIELPSATAITFPPKTPDRTTPLPFGSGEEYLRLLREAQRESNQSSRVVSLSSSRRDSLRGSPKSPPNSPNTELNPEDELTGVYINDYNKEKLDDDWVWGWSSRLDAQPPKDWKFEHPKGRVGPGYSMRLVRVGKNSLFSREVIYGFLLTNVISAILGVGIGVWLSRKGYVLTRLSIE